MRNEESDPFEGVPEPEPDPIDWLAPAEPREPRPDSDFWVVEERETRPISANDPIEGVSLGGTALSVAPVPRAGGSNTSRRFGYGFDGKGVSHA